MSEDNWRAPELLQNETVLFDEPGRSIPKGFWCENYGIDCNSHHFRVIQPQFGNPVIAVKHGGGTERIRLDYRAHVLTNILSGLDTNSRYTMLYMLYDANRKGAEEAQQKTKAEYSNAFVEGRLKKKRKGGSTFVHIDPKEAATA